ncbi:MAG: hypothetical protein AB4911_12640 [Oscillochloridaceae bacterium umkhey_bin13]
MDAIAKHRVREILFAALTPVIHKIEQETQAEIGPGIMAHLVEHSLTTLVAIAEAQAYLRQCGMLNED